MNSLRKYLPILYITSAVLILALVAGTINEYYNLERYSLLIAVKSYGDKDYPLIKDNKLKTANEEFCGPTDNQPRLIKGEDRIKRFYAEQKEFKNNPNFKINDLIDKCIFNNNFTLKSINTSSGIQDINTERLTNTNLETIDSKYYNLDNNLFISSNQQYDFTQKSIRIQQSMVYNPEKAINTYTFILSNSLRSKTLTLDLPVLDQDKHNQQYIQNLGMVLI
jgi:hypothetical protein